MTIRNIAAISLVSLLACKPSVPELSASTNSIEQTKPESTVVVGNVYFARFESRALIGDKYNIEVLADGRQNLFYCVGDDEAARMAGLVPVHSQVRIKFYARPNKFFRSSYTGLPDLTQTEIRLSDCLDQIEVQSNR
jgi:hypothetical protein